MTDSFYRCILPCKCCIPNKLLVHKPLDAHLRGLLERLVHDLDLRQFAVRRENLVGCDADLLRNIRDSLRVKPGLSDGILVEIYEAHKFGRPVNDNRLYHIVLAVDNSLDFLRIDVLSVGTENHALAPSADEYVAFSVNDAKVTGTEISVFGKCGG